MTKHIHEHEASPLSKYRDQVRNVIAAELATLDSQTQMQLAMTSAFSDAITAVSKKGKLPPSPLALLTRPKDEVYQSYSKINGPAFLAMSHAFTSPTSTIHRLDSIASSIASGTPIAENSNPSETEELSLQETVPVTLAAAELLAIDPETDLSQDQAQILSNVISKAYSCAIHKGYLGGDPRTRKASKVFRRVSRLSGDVLSAIGDVAQAVSTALSAFGLTTDESEVDKIANLTQEDWQKWLSTQTDTDLDKAIAATKSIASIQGLLPDVDVSTTDVSELKTYVEQELSKARAADEELGHEANAAKLQSTRLQWVNFIFNLSPDAILIINQVTPDATTIQTAMQSLSAAALALASDTSLSVQGDWKALLQKLVTAPSSAVSSYLTSNTPEL